MESKEKSKVWLVSLESDSLSQKERKKIKKDLLFEYKPGEELILPVGYIIEHPRSYKHIWEDYGDGFSQPTNIVANAIYSGVQISHLEGELLTLMDAAFPDKEQGKAIKDLVSQTLWKFNYSQAKRVKAIFESED